MIRPCYLVIDRDFPGSISTRKLVIETAKFNVITAYSGTEAVETIQMFPNIHGAVIDADIHDIPCDVLIGAMRQVKPELRIVVISGPSGGRCEGADLHLESFDPRSLLEVLRGFQPEEVAAIEAREEKLNREVFD